MIHIFALTDSWQAYIDDCWAYAQIETGPRDEATCREVQIGRGFGDVTIGEALDAAGRQSLPILRWLATNRLQVLDTAARERFLSMLGRLDPPLAAVLYVWHPGLTDKDDEILKAAFYPTMARMRRKVEAGTCKRAKHG